MHVHLNDVWIRALREKLAGAPAATIEVELRGAEPFHVVVGAEVEVRQGRAPRPTAIVKAHPEDFGDLVCGELDPAQALIDGRLRVSGDLVRIRSILKRFFGPPRS